VVDPVDPPLTAAMTPPEVLVRLKEYATSITKRSEFRLRFQQAFVSDA
jgi:hypothetical protein